MDFHKILIVGFGTMARAMVDGWLAAGLPAASFTVYHPRGTGVPKGITVRTTWPDDKFDAVLIAVKPHKLAEIAAGLEPLIGPETVLLSVLAGVQLESLSARFPRGAGLVRFMPNLACALGKSPNALAAIGLNAAQQGCVTRLAEMLGSAEWLADETQFDLVTALTGSGPAFVYRFVGALAAAATELGLERVQADRLALAMVEGASALAARSDLTPAELASAVASPGGMTQKGLDVLDNEHTLQALLALCLQATRDRGAEMAAAVRQEG